MHLLPMIYVHSNSRPVLLTHADDRAIALPKGIVMSFAIPQSDSDMTIDSLTVGIKPILRRFNGLLGQIAFISLLIGALALAPTFYNMALYDHIIAADSGQRVIALLAGVMAALGLELGLRTVRNRQLGYFAARFDHLVNCSVFERLLFLPPALTEKASISAQLARLRDFETVREFMTGPLASLIFEMPLVLVYLGVMGALTGNLVFIPLALVLSYVGIMAAMRRSLQHSARRAANLTSQRQEFTLEMLTKLPAIRLAGLEAIWLNRYQNLTRDAANASFRNQYQAQILEVMSYALMTLGAITTLAWGVHKVILQDMTTGMLVGGMMMLWRIMAPLQVCCAAMTRLQQLMAGTQQVQRLLQMPLETPGDTPVPSLQFKGHVTFSRVTLRYSTEAEPALLGVSFDVKPGQVVAIKGLNGSGKSSLLKLILGLYQPQGGAVRIDGMDLRQFDPRMIRQHIAYVPQALDFLPGTIRDNLHYAAPEATEEDCYAALAQACAIEEVMQLPKGLDTVVAGEHADAVPFLLQQRLNLARAYVKKAKIILCDEASQSLGKDNDDAFHRMIATQRGTATIFLVTHRDDHMRLADQILLMEKGELIATGNAPSGSHVLKKDKIA